MPYTIKPGIFKYKDPNTGEYQEVDVLAGGVTPAQIINAVAPTEASSTSSVPHAVGSYFFLNGILYETTAAIAQGGTITPGTNCQTVPNGLGGEVSDLKSDIDEVTDKMSYQGSLNIVSPDMVEQGVAYNNWNERKTGESWAAYAAVTIDHPEPGTIYTYWKRNGTNVWNADNSKMTYVNVFIDGVFSHDNSVTNAHSFTIPSNIGNVTKIVCTINNPDGYIPETGMICIGTDMPAAYENYIPPFWTASDDFLPTVTKKLGSIYSVKSYGAKGDGATIDTAAIRAAITAGAGKVIYFPAGTYLIDGSLEIPSNTMVVGDGKSSIIKVTSNAALTSVVWRVGRNQAGLIMYTAQNSENITFKDFVIDGALKTTGADGIWGLAVYYTANCLCENVDVKNINYVADRVDEVYGFGLFVFNSNNVIIRGGTFVNGGYECVGGEFCNHVTVQDSFIGTAWRVPLQFHQGSHDIKILGNTIIATGNSNCMSIITLHGQQGGEFTTSVSDVIIQGNYLKGETINDPTRPYCGGIQSVWRNEQNIIITDNTFDCTNYCICNGSDRREGDYVNDGWVITLNRIKGKYGINIWADNVIVKNNIIDTTNAAIAVSTRTQGGSARIVDDNLFLDDDTVLDTVTR